MSNTDTDIDWSKTTWDGSRREQLRRWRKATLRERLLAVEEMADLSRHFAEVRAQRRSSNLQETAGNKAVDAPPRFTGVHESNSTYTRESASNEIVLEGCTPTPLANYLKALGVLRLLSAKYPDTRGFWRGDKFVLHTTLDRAGIERFFLDEYAPTPLVAPWGARSGFYDGSPEKTAREALYRIESSTTKRLQFFRETVDQMRGLLMQHGITKKATDDEKLELLRICRCELPDKLLNWLDTCYVLTGEGRTFPPLLGTGGNEGSGSYVSGYYQQVVACIIDHQHDPSLSASLFNKTTPDAVADQTPGHFSPSSTGGVNAAPGFADNRANMNPWDYILAIEGTLVLAGAVVRRNADDPEGTLSYPFTVHAVFSGAGSLAEGDDNKPKGEVWLPLWRQSASYAEVRSLMAEGRVANGKKPAHDALDFVRAVHRLGGYRGIRAFQRFGLLKRNGRSYFATSLACVEVASKPHTRWLDDLDKHGWLDRFRKFARDDNTASRFHILRKRLEDTLFILSGREPSKPEAEALLILLGEIQLALSSSRKAVESVRPIPRLSERWVMAADDDGTPAFRIAKALAGLRGVGDEPLPLRAQLFPVHRKFDQWMTPEAGEKARIHTGLRGRLTDTLSALLERRLWLAGKMEMKDKPLSGPTGATLADVAAFLRDGGMDERIAALLPGLCLCEIPRDIDNAAGGGVLPAAFGLLKLALTPDRTLRSLGRLGEHDHLPIPAGMLAQLSAGNHDNRAVKIAWRRLRSSGMTPGFSAGGLPDLAAVDPRRAAAALLIPLRYGATSTFACSLLNTTETDTQSEIA